MSNFTKDQDCKRKWEGLLKREEDLRIEKMEKMIKFLEERKNEKM